MRSLDNGIRTGTTTCGDVVDHRGVGPPAPAVPTTAGPWDWPTYGHDAQHTFHGRTTLTASTVKTLRKAWVFPTGDSVTATPTVVDGVVYVGSWDDTFYAVDLATGTLRWKTRVKPQNGVKPYPGEVHRDLTSDGGLITSSAWFEPAGGGRPALVIFGGGYTLYALNAANGAVYWEHDYTGRPDRPPDPDTDGTRIFSSPVVADGLVLFGVDVDGATGYRGYVVGASLATGDPVWEYQTDVNARGPGARRRVRQRVVVGHGAPRPGAGGVRHRRLRLHQQRATVRVGPRPAHHAPASLAWHVPPAAAGPRLRLGLRSHRQRRGRRGRATPRSWALGSKDGTYYSLDPATGHAAVADQRRLRRVLGRLHRHHRLRRRRRLRRHRHRRLRPVRDRNGSKQTCCDPSNPRDTPSQEPTDHAFDAAHRRGAVAGEPGRRLLGRPPWRGG